MLGWKPSYGQRQKREEELWLPPPWQGSRPGWTRLGAPRAGGSGPHPGQRGGTGWSVRSLPTQTILWFYDLAFRPPNQMNPFQRHSWEISTWDCCLSARAVLHTAGSKDQSPGGGTVPAPRERTSSPRQYTAIDHTAVPLFPWVSMGLSILLCKTSQSLNPSLDLLSLSRHLRKWQIFSSRGNQPAIHCTMTTEPSGLLEPPFRMLHGNIFSVKSVCAPKEGRSCSVHWSTTDDACQHAHITSSDFNSFWSLETLPNSVQNYQFLNNCIPLNSSFTPEAIVVLANS